MIGQVHRLVRRRADLIEDQPGPLAVALTGCVQQEIGEAQIGEERPFGGQPEQVIDVVLGQIRVGACELGQRRGHNR